MEIDIVTANWVFHLKVLWSVSNMNGALSVWDLFTIIIYLLKSPVDLRHFLFQYIT